MHYLRGCVNLFNETTLFPYSDHPLEGFSSENAFFFCLDVSTTNRRTTVEDITGSCEPLGYVSSLHPIHYIHLEFEAMSRRCG